MNNLLTALIELYLFLLTGYSSSQSITIACRNHFVSPLSSYVALLPFYASFFQWTVCVPLLREQSQQVTHAAVHQSACQSQCHETHHSTRSSKYRLSRSFQSFERLT